MSNNKSLAAASFNPAWMWLAAIVGCGLSLSGGIALVGLELPNQTRVALLSEDGPIEIATVVIYLLVAATLFIWAASSVIRRASFKTPSLASNPAYLSLLGFCVLCFAARELDWHSKWTSYDIFKTRFYVEGNVGIAEKSTALIAISLISTAFISVLMLSRSTITSDWKNGRWRGTLPFAAVAFIVISKGIDTTSGKLKETGLITQAAARWLLCVEELAELLIPMVFALKTVLALQAYLRSCEAPVGEDSTDASTIALPQPRSTTAVVTRRAA